MIFFIGVPVIIEPRQQLKINENETQTLNCAIHNDISLNSDKNSSKNYATTFEWTKNGLQVRPSNNIQVI